MSPTLRSLRLRRRRALVPLAGLWLLAVLPGPVGAEGLWDRVKEGAVKGGELIEQGVGAAGSLAQAGKEAVGAGLLSGDTADPLFRQGTPAQIRARVDAVAAETLEQLRTQAPEVAPRLARGDAYAVFEIRQFALALAAGYGYGVAVGGQGAERIYMKAATAGLELSKGRGGIASRWVVLFADPAAFRSFVDEGFDAAAQADAEAGTLKAGKARRYRDGLTVYRVGAGGFKLAASVTGTRFWPDAELNPPAPPAPVEERALGRPPAAAPPPSPAPERVPTAPADSEPVPPPATPATRETD